MLTSAFNPRVIGRATLFAIAAIALVFTNARSATITYTEGCMGQWLFNGVWRVHVTHVDPLMDGTQQVGWEVTESWRNGSTQTIAPGDTFLTDQVLELADGTKIAASATNSGGMSMGVVSSHTLAEAAQFTYVQDFRAAGINPATKPKAVTILFDGDKLAQFVHRPQFTTHHYDFRVKLDCQASGEVGAQGGAFELPAAQGCMNQWMSNGLWRVRATAVAPFSDPGSPQTGWLVSEAWTSLMHASIEADDTLITTQQLVLGNGDTLGSDAGVRSSGSFGQLAGHTFAPGGSFTYQQLFIQIPFDTVDKPVKLIVTFDAATLNTNPNRPHYTVNPPNFRINLECSK